MRDAITKEVRIPRRPKKFRFQIIANWLINEFEPCKVADVGGGKGLLSYLLNESGWDSTVIDPFDQQLPHKYKSLDKKRVKIENRDAVKRETSVFKPEQVKDYDLIIGIHTHGANIQIIEACKEYGKDFLLIPCCVINEPIEKKFGVNWRKSLIGYSIRQGFEMKTVQFNFMGKNIALYSESNLRRKANREVDYTGLLQDEFTKDTLIEEDDYIDDLETLENFVPEKFDTWELQNRHQS
jgi:hypothetical protein